MEISRNSERLSTILMMALVFWAGSATAQEQRCNELGAVCKCSEPLNVDRFTTSGSDQYINPSDTNSKECHGGVQAFEVNPGSTSQVVPTAETGMPPGNTVDYVLRNNRHYGIALIGYANKTLQSSTKRLCYRHYFRMSTDYDGPTDRCDAGKFSQIKWSQTYDLQMGSGGHFGVGSPWEWWHYWPSGAGNNNMTQSGTLKWSDCYGEWCRIEVCASGDFAGGTGNFFSEAYIERLSDRKRVNWPRYNLGSGNPGLNVATAGWIVNSYREGSSATCQGYDSPQNFAAWREVSHLMQAEWTEDQEGLFIGAAYEVEGGNGSLPLPPPSGEPAPAPTSTGDFSLQVGGIISGGGAIVTSTVTAGVGPYQFLFDCGNVGSWHGIINTSSTSAQYTCPLSGQSSIDVRAWVWDQATNAVRDMIAQIDAATTQSTLGKPGVPTYTAP